MASEPLMNFSRLREVSDGDEEFARELAGMYKDSCDEQILNLQNAVEAGIQEQAILFSHDIKGSSANIGADRAKTISANIETSCRNGKFLEAKQQIPFLERALLETYSLLEKY